MTTAQVLGYFDQISEAPAAIPRLRRFVLDLAVRGWLLPQNPDDEPASELLKRIEREKVRLVKSGELRKPRDFADAAEMEAPFALPATWRWVRLDAVGAIVGGGTPSSSDADNFAEPGEGIPWLTPADLGGYLGRCISRGARDLSEKGVRTSSATLMPVGTVLFTSRAPIGYVAIAANPISTNQGFKSIVPYVADCSRFIATAMKAFAPEIAANAPGTTFKEVSGKIVAAIPFPLPPLAEQRRIVAKVDELMVLCDRLQAARAEREATRNRLTTASLARLNAPDPNPAAFVDQARFALGNLGALTTRPDQVKELRQTILNLAVRGKLVPQAPIDDPASVLLAHIAEEKERLVKCGEIKKEKSLPPLSPDSAPFDIPPTWAWTRLETIALKISDGEHLSPNKTSAGMPLLTAIHVTAGAVTFDHPQYVSWEDGQKFRRRCDPRRGDILICSRGTIGRCAVVETDEIFCLMGSVIQLRVSPMCLPNYIEAFLATGAAQAEMRGMSGSTAVSALYLKDLRPCAIPLPPLAEQRRIVTMVDELMALCDRLEESLTLGVTRRSRLLEALLHEALAPTQDEAA